MHWTFGDCENDASEMRAVACVAENELLTAEEIGRAAGLDFCCSGVCGCEAQVDVEACQVMRHVHGYEWTQNFNDAHEVGHVVRTLADDPFPHDEEQIDFIALALLMPREPTLDVLRRVGSRDPSAIISAWPKVPPARALIRTAWVGGFPVTVHKDRVRLVWAPDGYPVPERGTFWEQRLVRDARVSGREQRNLTGAAAIPFEGGVMVLLPESLAASGW